MHLNLDLAPPVPKSELSLVYQICMMEITHYHLLEPYTHYDKNSEIINHSEEEH